MRIRFERINPYLAVLVLCLAGACKSAEERQQSRILAAVHLHLSARGQDQANKEVVTVAGVAIPVERDFFLDERSVVKAAVVDSPGGGFVMRLEFNEHGRMMIENVTGSNLNRQMPIFSQFGTKKTMEQGAWLAAPLITTRILDGVLVFTPCVPRETAETIATGLNNIARALSRPLSW